MWLGTLSDRDVESNTAGAEWLAELARHKRAAQIQAPCGTVWIAAERLPEFQALWPRSQTEPPIAAPSTKAARVWTRNEALVEILRSRLEGEGPITEEALSILLGVEGGDLKIALAALETEGFAMAIGDRG